jgi:hypothetical protein
VPALVCIRVRDGKLILRLPPRTCDRQSHSRLSTRLAGGRPRLITWLQRLHSPVQAIERSWRDCPNCCSWRSCAGS